MGGCGEQVILGRSRNPLGFFFFFFGDNNEAKADVTLPTINSAFFPRAKPKCCGPFSGCFHHINLQDESFWVWSGISELLAHVTTDGSEIIAITLMTWLLGFPQRSVVQICCSQSKPDFLPLSFLPQIEQKKDYTRGERTCTKSYCYENRWEKTQAAIKPRQHHHANISHVCEDEPATHPTSQQASRPCV